ncbi:MAG: hypothetical protein BWY63_02762 [Chloroflexi bacterium ADurb.Bin360]|nr:MAG: hypothetical protein BWY63_02762 [Chloroflexi bacterium ADurb.Bin360]
MRPELVLARIVDVVGRNQGESQLTCQGNELCIGAPLFSNGMGLQFQVKTPRKVLLVPARHLPCLFFLSFEQQTGNLALQTGTEHDQAFAVLQQRLFINARFVIEAFQLRQACQREQIEVPLLVLRQQDEVIGFTIIAVMAEAGFGRDIGFHADDRFDPGRFARLVEVHDPIHHAMIGDGKSLHTKFGGAFSQRFGAAQSIEQRIFCMCMQVDKFRHGLAPLANLPG